MTGFGKLLVFTQLVLSLLFLGWAVGVYTQRVDWAPPKTIGGDPVLDVEGNPKKGKVAELADDIKNTLELRDVAEKRWLDASPALAAAEDHRTLYQDWYKNMLSGERTGKDTAGKEVKPAVRVLEVNKETGEYPIEGPAKAVEANGKPLEYLDFYSADYDDLKKQIGKAQESYDANVVKARDQAEKINGIPGKSPGLRRELGDQLSYYKNCLDEMRYLVPLRDSTDASRNALLKRNFALKARLEELEKVAANQGR